MIALVPPALRVVAALVALAAGAYVGFKAIEDPANQFFGHTVVSGSPNEPAVALTYDDGPNPPYTDRILDVLREERVPATFFVVGRAVEAYPATVRRIVREGHALGNHTWDHPHLIALSSAQIDRQLRRADEVIARVAGVHTRLMRPPYGQRDFTVLDVARKDGYTVVMWSVPLPKDWEQPGDATIARRVIDYVRDGSIIVLHDGNRGLLCTRDPRLARRTCDRTQDVAATRMIVETLRRRGFRFVTIPQLLAAQAGARERRQPSQLNPSPRAPG